MIEKEIKIMLTKNQYERLYNYFEYDETILQVNHYFGDREDRYKKKDTTVRVREIDGKFYLQVKCPVENKDNDKELAESINKKVRMEYEEELEKLPELITKEHLYDLTKKELFDAAYLGYLETKRMLCRKYENVEICLDYNKYLGIEDYEIEIEYTGDYPEYIINELEKLSIETDKPCKGKYSRFLGILSTLN